MVPYGLPESEAELVEDFSVFDDWEGRYAYLLDLAKRLPPLDDALKTEENKVRGCMSQVWFVREDDPQGRLFWKGDSDAAIVRGLIAVLQVLLAGKTRDEVARADVEGVFQKLGLESHLSMNRRNGFFAMVNKLKEWPS